MSVMQALQLLKYFKGVTKIRTPWNPSRNGYFSWLIMINEGGAPVNLTIGVYNKKHQEKLGKWFICFYAFGKRWIKKA